jgi:hypothetical protein
MDVTPAAAPPAEPSLSPSPSGAPAAPQAPAAVPTGDAAPVARVGVADLLAAMVAKHPYCGAPGCEELATQHVEHEGVLVQCCTEHYLEAHA